MADIHISKINETWMKVECSEVYMEMEISDRFSFKVQNAQYDARVKYGKWDGVKRLYNRKFKRMYCGLLLELLKFIKKQGYSYKLDKSLVNLGDLEMSDLVAVVKEAIQPHDKGNAIEPYDYQYDCVLHMMNASRSISLASTSAGKSLCIYMAVRMYQFLEEMQGKHIFIIVPSKMLVEQMYGDFDNYSTHEKQDWHVAAHCQRVNGDYSKFINKQIVITTWQSLKDIPKSMLADAGAIIVDEVHTVNGPVLTSLMESATGCSVRHGLTGTLDGLECNELAAQGLMGPVKRIVSAKELIAANRATRVKVHCVVYDYDRETKQRYVADQNNVPKSRPGLKYQSEVNFINNLECRKNSIIKMVKMLKGNVIVLFNRVEGYGVPLYEIMKEEHENTFIITGDVKGKEREEIRQKLENIDDAVVFATSKIMSTGVSIKNLHHIVLVGSSKAKIGILQTIGRLMRLHESKQVAHMYDIVDRLDLDGKANYTMKHLEERLKFYKAEDHPVEFVTIKLVEQPEHNLFSCS